MASSWSVLVVCEGNLARSPLVSALLSQQWPTGFSGTVRIGSAGTHARVGEPAAEQMRAVAGSLDVDLDGHRSRPLTPKLLAASDLVLTMTERQREEVQRLLPSVTTRTFTLVEFVRLLRGQSVRHGDLVRTVEDAHLARPCSIGPASPEDVEDPYGRSNSAFGRVATILAALVRELADLLATNAGAQVPPAHPGQARVNASPSAALPHSD